VQFRSFVIAAKAGIRLLGIGSANKPQDEKPAMEAGFS
jgi:hypothetical protein